MKRNAKRRLRLIGLVGLMIFIFLPLRACSKKEIKEKPREAVATYGEIRSIVSTTGTVQPQNRLEIKPPVDGRVDTILVKEGDQVKQGDILVWMSSKERAALIDMARAQGDATLKYWQEAYKPTALIAPINGQVIVRAVEPGQSVDPATAVLVLSDRLIVKAQVDETDIGKIKVGQAAVITLDAYPSEKIKAIVDHIAYESKTVSNVTTYQVDVLPETVPDVFRSGLSSTVTIVIQSKAKALIVPLDSVVQERGGSYLWVKSPKNKKIEKRMVRLGLADDMNTEILSGLNPNETVVVKREKKMPPEKMSSHRDFFSPFARKKN